jgi:hypothetical protein
MYIRVPQKGRSFLSCCTTAGSCIRIVLHKINQLVLLITCTSEQAYRELNVSFPSLIFYCYNNFMTRNYSKNLEFWHILGCEILDERF